MDNNSKITREVKKTADVLREIITIILALAFTTAIITFMTDGGTSPKEFTKSNFTLESIYVFISVIITIIRFYHGNMNYLSRTYNIPDYEAITRKNNYKLAIDFFFIFLQGIIFCGLASYQVIKFEFYLLFAILFFIDSIWFFVIINFVNLANKDFEAQHTQEYMKALTNWMVVNFTTGVVILFIIYSAQKETLPDMIPLLFTVIMINTVLDYGLNRKLYFPVLKRAKNTSVFVAARFTTAIENGIFDSELKRNIEIIHEAIRSLGVILYSSHHIEKYGENLSYAEDAVERDISQISICDIFVALLEDKLSAGVCTELGWASFMGKKIILIVPNNFNMDQVPLIKGLNTITYCEIIRYEDNNILRDRLHSVLQPFILK